jgi:hypothetical protein
MGTVTKLYSCPFFLSEIDFKVRTGLNWLRWGLTVGTVVNLPFVQNRESFHQGVTAKYSNMKVICY